MVIQTMIFLYPLLLKSTLFIFFILQTSAASNYLPRGSSISVEDASSTLLISPDKTFTCGFHNTTNAYYFSIWFTNSKDKTIVWTANRDSPVNGRGSRLSLRKDGALVLTDFDGSSVWETNTSSTAVEKAELLNSGNFVLKDPNGKILWQSFDFSTDTLLPNQLLTKNKRLVSRISYQEFGSGYFNFFFDNDNVLKLIYDGPEISSLYWPKPDNNVFQEGRTSYNSSLLAFFDDRGTFVSSDYLQFNVSDVGKIGIKRRLTMDHDGNLRFYSLNNDASGLWVMTWQAMSKPCHVHGLCGRNGICIYTPEPTCSCPPYYEPVNSSDWSKGCKPKFEIDCLNSRFLEVPYVDFFGFDINTTYATISFEDCQQRCLRDCRCQAFKHAMTLGTWNCYTKSALFNGYRFQGSIHIRIPKKTQISKPEIDLNSHLDCGDGEPKIQLLPKSYSDSSKQTFKWVYVYAFGGAIGAIELIILVASWCFLFKKHGFSNALEDGYQTISSQFRSFRYSELKRATKNFRQVLGIGGFGAVYRGILPDERVIAVKKLENIVQGEEEFWAEVSTFGKINHMNLARMWGFCCEGKHRLLVYEYIENGSLDEHLFSTSSLNKDTILGWEKRFKIALGTAKGLAYLHHECLEWVIHCDVKPENILLDSNFEP